MKKTHLFISILLLSTTLFSQTAITSQKTFGGDNFDFSTDIQELLNGTFVACGISMSGVSGSKTTPNYGDDDGWIVNFNADFSINWELNIGGSNNDRLFTVLPTDDGGFLCGGGSLSGINGNKTSPNLGSYDYWLFKINSSGVILWEKTYGGSASETISSMAKLDNGFVLCGSSQSPISGDKTEACRGSSDYWIVNIDANGIIIWNKTIGGNSVDNGNDVIVDNNSIYFVGSSNSNTSYEKTEDSYGLSDYWIVKLDVNGNVVWDKIVGGSNLDYGYNALIKDNYIYICGNSMSDISGNKMSASNGQDDIWVVKLDTNGIIMWDNTFGGNLGDYSLSILELSSTRILIAGSSESDISGDISETGNGGRDFWFFSINNQGDMVEQKKIGGSSFDMITSVIQLNNSNLLLLGDSGSNISGDKTENGYGFADFWLVKVSSTMDIVTNESTSNLTIFPNPNSGMYTLFGLDNYSIISIYDLQGKLINEIRTTTESEIKINHANNLEKGIYLISIKNEMETTVLKYVVN
jgi:hypothetical protein